MAVRPYTFSHDPVSTKKLNELLPQILTSGDTVAVATDCRVTYFKFNNPTAADITVSVRDGNGVYLLAPELLGALGGEIEFDIDGAGYPCAGSCTISTSATGVHAYLRSEVLSQ